MSADSNSYVKENPCRGKVLRRFNQSEWRGSNPRNLSLPKRALYHLSYIPKIDVQVKGCTHILIPHDLNHKQQPHSGIKPVFPVHV